MELLQKLKSKFRGIFKNDGAQTMTLERLERLFSGGISVSSFGGRASDLSEITYYTCLKVLSESLGKLPCYLIDDEKRRIHNNPVSYVLAVCPNEYQTPSQFFTYLEFCRNHYGNAYAYIQRDPYNGKPVSLLPLEPRRVQIWINNTDKYLSRRYLYIYSDIGGKQYEISPDEMLHVKAWLTDDNLLVGRSAREILATSLAGAKASSEFLNDLYQRGLLARACVKYVGDLRPASQEALLNRIEEQANFNGRRMIALPVGFDIQRLDLNLTDSQFFELKRFSAQQIAAVFGVEPNQLNDYSKASYANSVAQNLSFYVDTLLPIVNNYEQEFRVKLLSSAEIRKGWKVKFNINAILRPDPSAQATIMATMLANGVYTLDEVRGMLDMPPHEDGLGSTPLLNAAYKPLKDIEQEEEEQPEETPPIDDTSTEDTTAEDTTDDADDDTTEEVNADVTDNKE